MAIRIRLDDAPLVGTPAPSINDYRDEYRAFWHRFAARLAKEGIAPQEWPPASWWYVEYLAHFDTADGPRVFELLTEFGVRIV
jgi:hypothetical protein